MAGQHGRPLGPEASGQSRRVAGRRLRALAEEAAAVADQMKTLAEEDLPSSQSTTVKGERLETSNAQKVLFIDLT